MTEATRILSEFAVSTSLDDIPEAVREKARFAIIDSIGTALIGINERSVELVRETALGDYRSGEATVLGCGRKAAAPAAALANASAAHALDFDNISLTVSGFVTTPILFALLAVAEEEDNVSGERLLQAFIIGSEVEAAMARGLGVHHYAAGWHSTATLGHFGATVALGKLLGLDVMQMRYAIGIVASETSGLRTMVGNMTNPFHVGKAARNAILAARLAARGFVAHDHVLEASWGFCRAFNGENQYDLQAMVANLGQPYDLIDPGLVIKVYPCCGLIHSGIDAVIELVEEHEIDSGEVQSVRLAVHDLVPKTMNFEHPETAYQGKFSIPFCIATAIIEGAVKLHHFSEERIRDSIMHDLMARIEVVVHPELHGHETFLQREFTDVCLTLKNGRTFEARVMRLDNRGSKGRPATLADIEGKFQDCLGANCDPERANRAFRLLCEIENITDIREVTECLT